jgi:hypothetical protein
VPQARRPTLPLRLLGLALIVALGPRPSGSRAAEDPSRDVGLTIVSQSDHSLIRPGDPGTQGNKYGFEGGSVVKLGGIYHLFTSEMVGDPRWVKMRLARWTSRDRTTWKREATLYESSGNFDGTDPRAALWAPMPVFSDRTDHWELFYVAYRCAPDTPEKWLGNYEGRIWRAVSTQAGRGGIAGPYNDVGVILEPGKLSDPWEGLQGTDSFYPYKAAGRWYGFYGSARTEVKPSAYWKVGLASAPRPVRTVDASVGAEPGRPGRPQRRREPDRHPARERDLSCRVRHDPAARPDRLRPVVQRRRLGARTLPGARQGEALDQRRAHPPRAHPRG